MHFAFDDDQEQIRRSAREMLARHASLGHVRAAAETGAGDERLWAAMIELGWPALAIGEDYGGLALGTVALVALAEEVGRAVAPSPLLGTVSGGLVLDAGGSPEQRERWLPGIADGRLTATVARTRAGATAPVADAAGADVLVLVGESGATLAAAADATVEPVETIDRTRRYGRVIGAAGAPLAGDWRRGVQRADVMLAAELTGLAQRALELTVAYVKDRRQFGTPIGAFQGISHRCAEMFFKTESARSATYYAAWVADAEPERLPAVAAMAAASAASAALEVAGMAIQAHGGIGFTWEADLHWIYKRALLGAAQLGRADTHRREIARLAAARLRADAAGMAT